MYNFEKAVFSYWTLQVARKNTLKTKIMSDYRICHFLFSIPAILILIATFFHYRKIQKTKDHPDKRGLGLIWLILCLLVWVTMSLLKSESVDFIKDGDGTFPEIIFSIGNSILLLFAFPYFKHRFDYFESEENRNNWNILLGLIAVVFIIGSFIIGEIWGKNIGSLPDILLTTCTLIPLGILLNKNFVKRELNMIGVLSWITILVLLCCQFVICYFIFNEATRVIESEVYQFAYVSSFISLATIFVALAFSSIEEELKEINKEKVELVVAAKNKEIQNWVTKGKGESLREKIAEAEIQDVITFLRNYTTDNELVKERKSIDLLSARWSKLDQDGTLGFLKNEEQAIEFARISNALLKLIDKVFGKINGKE